MPDSIAKENINQDFTINDQEKSDLEYIGNEIFNVLIFRTWNEVHKYKTTIII